jgi:hypothetical protein
MGTGHYVFDASGGNDIVTLTNGLISAIDAAPPSGPCITGSTAICPGVIYSGAEFFTDAPTACSPGEVCGTLDFTGSAPGPIPEPATIALLATGLLGWAAAAAKRPKARAAPGLGSILRTEQPSAKPGHESPVGLASRRQR